ncbi:MAG: alpha/beta family hydrolase [Actinomycetes bacterium]
MALGHGAGGGIDAPDMLVLTAGLVAGRAVVARFEQPWKVAGRRIAGPATHLDEAWVQGVHALAALSLNTLPLIVGGRSTGARVASRTGCDVGALGVVALAFPLHPPRRPDRSRAGELSRLPTLVIQGGRDAFGDGAAVSASGALGRNLTVVDIAGADHGLRVGRAGPITQPEADEIVGLAGRRWMLQLLAGNLRGSS